MKQVLLKFLKSSKMPNGIGNISLLMLFAGTLLVSCSSDPLSPGYEFMPDMYRSPSYETYGENPLFEDSMASRLPVEGTIPFSKDTSKAWVNFPYPYPNTNEGYEMSAELKTMIPYSEAVVAEGKVIFDKMCVHCHGATGQGDGKVAMNPKFPGPPPPYNGPQLKDLPEGKMFHSITFGKGSMGSHSSQLTKEERWKIIHYIKTLQNLGGKSDAAEDGGNAETENTETGTES